MTVTNHRDYHEGKYWARVSEREPWWVEIRIDHKAQNLDGSDGGFYFENRFERYETLLELGPRILPPGHPDAPSPCDLPRILELVAAYIAPSSPISYGRLVELLATVRGCEGYSYSDLYPVLFNVQSDSDPYPDDDFALVYDCDAAARRLLQELGIEPPPDVEGGESPSS